MSSNSNEREIARSFGFGRPRSRIPGPGVGQRGVSVAEALGLRAGSSVLLVGSGSGSLRPALAASGVRVVSILPTGQSEFVVYRADSTYALRRVSELASRLARNGVMWVLWPRSAGHISEQHVKRAGASAGLVGVHATHVDAQLSALKFIRSPDSW